MVYISPLKPHIRPPCPQISTLKPLNSSSHKDSIVFGTLPALKSALSDLILVLFCLISAPSTLISPPKLQISFLKPF